MTRRTAKPDQSVQSKQTILGPSVSLPALLDNGAIADKTFRQFVYDMSVVATHLESARQYLAEKLGVTSPQYNIVMVIARSGNENGVSVSDVATRLNVTGAFVTNEVKKLVKAQLIEKKANPEDGRGVLLSLSAIGYERVRALEPHLLMVNNRLFAHLTRDDFLRLARTIGSLVNVFGQTVAVLKVLPTESVAESHAEPAPPPKARAKPRRNG